MGAQTSDIPAAGIDAAVGGQGADLWGYVVVGIAVLAAVVYLVRRLGRSRKGCCCGCGETGTCAAAGLTDRPDAKPR